MATAAQSSTATPQSFTLIAPGRRLFTAADLAAMPEQLPSGPVSFELHHGRLVPMSPPGAVHGNLQNRIGGALLVQGEEKGHGKSYTEVGIVLARNPDDVRGADAAFVMKKSLPARESPEGFLEAIPELIVEIKSKNDTAAEIAEKVVDYLNAGAKLVWVLEPAKEAVVEHRPNSQPKTWQKSDSIFCDDIIPGFRLMLAELYRD
jgi:Uma2 family endonuclease